MKEWKTLLFILALVVSLSEGVGAAELKGRITDSEGAPIDYASVRVMSADSLLLAGTICDEAGEYSFDNLAASTVTVTAGSIGYESASKTVTLSDNTPSTVNLSLTVKAAELGEVTVTADRFMRTRQSLTVIPSKKQTAHASSGFELLRNLMIPGVAVNTLKGAVTALGGNTALYIDGQTAEQREIMQLRPEDVERVVFIDAPSGRYAGDNTAINFIMKKRESGGYVGLDATQRAGYTAGDYNLSMKYYRHNTQYTLFAGADYTAISGAKTERNELISFPQGDISRRYTTTADSEHKNSQYVWMRVRNKNDRRTLRATLNIVRNHTPRSFNASELTYNDAGLDGMTITANRIEKSSSMKYSLGLSGTFSPGNSQSIDASASASLTDTDYGYTYSEQGNGVSSSTAEKLVGLNASLSYVKTFSRGNSLTAKIYELCNISIADYWGSNTSRQRLSLSESLLFVEYMHPIGRIASVRVSPGVSLQAYRLSGPNAVVNSAPRAQAIFTIQPTQKQYMQLGAVLGNSYPQLSMLTGAITAVDNIHVKRGNPELPQTRIVNGMAVYAAGIGKVNLQAMMQYNYASSLPTTQYFIEESRLIQTFRGDGIWHMLSPTFSATWIPDSLFNLQISAGWLYNRYITPAVLTSSCITAEANLSWYVGSFAINIHLTAPRKVLGYDLVEVKTPWSYGISANWNKGNLKIEAGLSNPLSFHPEIRETMTDNVYRFNTARYTPADRCSGYVKASWSIDFGKKTDHEQRNVDKTIDSGILRAR